MLTLCRFPARSLNDYFPGTICCFFHCLRGGRDAPASRPSSHTTSTYHHLEAQTACGTLLWVHARIWVCSISWRVVFCLSLVFVAGIQFFLSCFSSRSNCCIAPPCSASLLLLQRSFSLCLPLRCTLLTHRHSITFSGWVRLPIGFIILREAGMPRNLPDLCLDAIPMQENPLVVADPSS